MACKNKYGAGSLVLMFYIIAHFKPCSFRTFTESDLKMYRNKVVEMFRHAYEGYLSNAFPYDELKPISCQGVDTWGSFSLTLIDALDTLAVMRNYSEFQRVVSQLVSTADFNININVSVFETNIRVVGGLISAHLLSQRAGVIVENGWPCSGPLLQLAEAVARRLLPAFQTNTGMPYGTVNLRYGVPPGETPVTCTAGVSTFVIEFGTLSRLTGDPVFEKVAFRALQALWERRSSIGLVGNHINVQEGKWTAMDAGIGGGVDSYYEYLVKGALLFQEPALMAMFQEYKRVITKYMKRDDWYYWVNMASGQVTMPVFQSLESFWPGLLVLVGEIEQALKTLFNYHQIWKQYGFTPEFYDVHNSHVKREGYPLRPELIESVMYLYQATKNPHLLEIGVDILESIEHSTKTKCGYATVKNVVDHRIEDRMESFFLAETTKYLYLLFDPGNFIHNNGSCGHLVKSTYGDCIIGTGGYIFNTEAHPIDVSAVYCCSPQRKIQDSFFEDFQHNMDLYSLLNIKDRGTFLKKRTKDEKFSRNNCKNSGTTSDCSDTETTLQDKHDDDYNDTDTASSSYPSNDGNDVTAKIPKIQNSKVSSFRENDIEALKSVKKNLLPPFSVPSMGNTEADSHMNYLITDVELEDSGDVTISVTESEMSENVDSILSEKIKKCDGTVNNVDIYSVKKLELSKEPSSKNAFSTNFPSVAADDDLPASENAALSFSSNVRKIVQSQGNNIFEPAVDVTGKLGENVQLDSENTISEQPNSEKTNNTQLPYSCESSSSIPVVSTIPLTNCPDLGQDIYKQTTGTINYEKSSFEVLSCPTQSFMSCLNIVGHGYGRGFSKVHSRKCVEVNNCSLLWGVI